jgi:hypothetical protein
MSNYYVAGSRLHWKRKSETYTMGRQRCCLDIFRYTVASFVIRCTRNLERPLLYLLYQEEGELYRETYPIQCSINK